MLPIKMRLFHIFAVAGLFLVLQSSESEEGTKVRLGDGMSSLLVFARSTDIRMVSLDIPYFADVVLPINGSMNFTFAIGVDPKEGKVYWSDITLDKVSRANLDGTEYEDIISTGLSSPDGLAVDAVGRKIYWTDSGTQRIEVVNLDGSMRKVLIWQNLDKPSAIALYQEMGYMYWTDVGNHAKLERSGMDGSERIVLISNNLVWPTGLAIDKVGSQLLWTDYQTKRIEVADLNGANRRTLVSPVQDALGLTLLGPHIYWTNWKSGSIQRANKATGTNVITVRDKLTGLRGIQAVDRETPLGFNRCGWRNGGCSHLCLPNPNGTSCACPTGILLRGDGRTCEDGPNTFLLFSNHVSICRISLDMADRTDVHVPVPELHDVFSLDYDSGEGKIYYDVYSANLSIKVIQRANLDGSGMETVIREGLKTTGGLAVDAVGRKIYWTDVGNKHIEVANLDGSMGKVLIWQNLDEPRAIALYQEMGYMYWTDCGEHAKLERSGMDGSERVVLITNNLVQPYVLAIDKAGSQLLWADAGTQRIEAADLNGANRRTLVSPVQNPVGLTLLGPHVYWTEWESRSIQRADKTTGANIITIRYNLRAPRGIQAVDRETPLGFNRCGWRNGGCSHLCLPNPNGTSCACPTGILLRGDGRTCEDGPKTFLLFSNHVSICRISLDTADHTDVHVPVPELHYTLMLDYDTVEGKIYYNVFSTNNVISNVRRANLDGSGMETVIREGLKTSKGLAVDAVGRKIYWTDAGNKRIEVANLDGSMRKVLIWQNLNRPWAIALYHEMGYMYWTDWGEHAKLERSGMDGSERIVLISNNLVQPKVLAIDKAGSQLLWADAGTQSIEAADLNGANRRTLVSPVQNPIGLTLLGPHIYWTEWESRSIQRADKTTGANVITIRYNLTAPRGIQAVDRETPLGFNRCGWRNGGCSHLCLPNPNGTSCACPTGILLRGDGCTCEDGPKTFLLFSNHVSICRISMDTADRTDVHVPVPELHRTLMLDYDSVEGKIYYSVFSTDNAIRRVNLDGSCMETVIGEGLKISAGLAVDAVGRKIYWADAGNKRIEVANLDGSMRKVLIWKNLDKPRAIALYQEMGYMYWTDRGEHAKLERSGMDGSERVVLISNNLVQPKGLAIDKAGSQLLWADAGTHCIEAADLNGANRRTLVSPVQNPVGLTLLGPHVYWTEWESRSIQRADKTTGANVITVRVKLTGPRGIQAVDRETPLGFNRCGWRNGGCSHLCLPNPNGTSCACPTGILLRGDGRTCEDGPKTFLLFSNDVSICRISMDTADHTDVLVPVPVSKLHDVFSLDYDSMEGKIYYNVYSANLSIEVFRRANLDGSGMETVIREGLKTTGGLAVDAVGRKIYWADAGNKRIEVANLDGSMGKVLIWQNLDEPRAIALYHEMGYMYWTDRGERAKLERSGMDGSERIVLISNNLVQPRGLAIDKAGSQLLWADAGTQRIEVADLNGANRRTLVSPVQNAIDLTLLGPHVYWTEWESRSIQRADKTTGANVITVRYNLTAPRGIQAVDREMPLGFNRCGGRNGGCSHLCLPNPNGTSCACPTGVLLRGDGHTCEDGPKTFLLFSTGDSIRRISMDTADHTDVHVPVPELHNVTSLDYDSVEGKIYYTDVSIGVIRRANLNGSGMETVFGEGLNTTLGLAVDAVGQKIYWTDAGTKRIEVANLDGSMRKVLIWQNLDEPRAIALHHEMGYMYWTDQGEHAKLERSGMDGSERIVLISKNLLQSYGLAIDKAGSQLLLADAYTKSIEVADLNGANRRTLVSLVNPLSLTLLGPRIYWTDELRGSIQRADKTTGANVITIRRNLRDLMSIQAVDRETPLGFNRCGGRNGGCSHLCLPNPNGTSCACPTGVLLKGDGHTCEDGPQTFLLFSTGNRIRRISMDTADRSDVHVPVPELHNVTSLDYDSVEGKIYYTDVSIAVIRRANLNSSGMETVVGEGLTTTDSLAVDWVARNMYWTDTGSNTIEVARLDGSTRKVLIKDSLDEPRAIAVFPSKGYLFWTDCGNISKIERAHLDGSDRRVLINTDLGWPNGLTLDYDMHRIFWVDAHLDRIESSDLNGKLRQILVSPVSHPFGLTQLKPVSSERTPLFHLSQQDRWIYWTDWQTKSIQRIDKHTGRNNETLLANVEGLMDIVVVSPQRQSGTNDCGVNNGCCTHLCLAKTNGFTCACPDTPDSRPCSTDVIPCCNMPLWYRIFRWLALLGMISTLVIAELISRLARWQTLAN